MADEQVDYDSGKRPVLLERSEIPVDRRKFMALAGGLGATALAGCGGSNDSDDSGSGGTLRVAAPTAVGAMDPHKTQTGWDFSVLLNIAEPLWELDTDLNIRGVLAEDLTTSDDNLTWDVKLREGVMFQPPHDRELVAEDVVANFDRIRSEGLSFPKNTIRHVSDWSAEGDYLLRMTFDDPASSAQAWMAATGGAQILAPENFENAGDTITEPIATGPFKFEEWQQRDHITFSAFDNYWDGDKPYVDELIYRYIPEPSAMITELLSGNPGVDILWSPPAVQLDTLKNNNNVSVKSIKGAQFNPISANCSGSNSSNRGANAPTQYREIRQAINYAANREAMLEVAVSGNGEATSSYFTEDNPWYYDYDPYGKSGQPGEAKDAIAESPLSAPVDITVMAPTSDGGNRADTGPVLQQNLNEAGFDVTFNEIEFGEWISRFVSGDFDVTPQSYPVTPHPDFLRTNIDPTYGDFLNYDSGPNTYSDQVYDLLEEGNATFDQAESKDIYDEMQELLIDDAAFVTYMIPDVVRAHRNAVNDYTLHPSNAFLADQIKLDR